MSVADTSIDTAQTRRPRSLIGRYWSIASLIVTLGLYVSLIAWSGTLTPVRLIKGTSMQPTLRSGDMVAIKSAPFSSISVGDVIAFRTPEPLRVSAGAGTVIHRVVAIEERAGKRVLITKGDNSALDTFPVGQEDLQGTLGARLPMVGLPLVFITSPKGIMFIGITTLLGFLYVPAFVIFYLVVIRRAASNEKATPAPAPAGDQSFQLERIMDELREMRRMYEKDGEPAPAAAKNIMARAEVEKRLLAGSYPSEVAALWKLHKQNQRADSPQLAD